MRCNDTCCRPEPGSDVQVFSIRRSVARIEHACTSCRGTITAGQAYVRTVNLIDGHIVTDKVHNPLCIPADDGYYY